MKVMESQMVPRILRDMEDGVLVLVKYQEDFNSFFPCVSIALLISEPKLRFTTCFETVIMHFSRSMSFHRSPVTSPTRIPV